MPGSALRLLNQGRAQGLFTPSTSLAAAPRPPGYGQPGYYPAPYPPQPYNALSAVSPTPPPMQPPLKRTRSDTESDASMGGSRPPPPALAASPDIQMADRSRPPSALSQDTTDGPSPNKRARTEPSPVNVIPTAPSSPTASQTRWLPRATPAFSMNGSLEGGSQTIVNGKAPPVEVSEDPQDIRFATKPSIPHNVEPSAPARDARRVAVIAHICQRDDPASVLTALREIPPDNPSIGNNYDVDLVLDDQGHTALHLAASMARHQIVHALIDNGADVHRGNYNGETALIRATLATANYDTQTFHTLVAALHMSIRTLDTARKSVLHHIVASAGVKGRAHAARYYLDQIFIWIAQHQAGDFKSLVDIQDHYGDTALNIAARVGNRSLVRTLLDVGANRVLPNRLGLRPGDYGVETEVSI